MADCARLTGLRFAEVIATEKTTWTFAELRDADGLSAVAEITCGGNTAAAARLTAELVGRLKGREIAGESAVEGLLGLAAADMRTDMALATAVSAVRSAVSDLDAQRRGLPLAVALGGERRESVGLYANINRHLMTRDRSPGAFAKAAELAVKNGFTTVKCAPFDGVGPPCSADNILGVAADGIARVEAVRAAVGDDVDVLVDCHSRFEEHTAPLVAERLALSNIGWFEEPLEPTKDAAGLARVRGRVSMPVAGGESGYGSGFFGALVADGAVDAVMPDVKYCGGVAEAVAAGKAAQAAGGNVSLHSPSGPISLIAGGHATAAMPGAMLLEHAVYEADWRAEAVLPNERVEGGRLWMPDGVGLGAALNDAAVSRRGRYWTP